MSFDCARVTKVEMILASLTPQEQSHCASFLASLHGSAPPVASAAPLAKTPPLSLREIERRARDSFRHGDFVEFTAKDGRLIQGKVVRINPRTLGLDNRWRVSPQLCRLVSRDEPFTPVRPGSAPTALPTAENSGEW